MLGSRAAATHETPEFLIFPLSGFSAWLDPKQRLGWRPRPGEGRIKPTLSASPLPQDEWLNSQGGFWERKLQGLTMTRPQRQDDATDPLSTAEHGACWGTAMLPNDTQLKRWVLGPLSFNSILVHFPKLKLDLQILFVGGHC